MENITKEEDMDKLDMFQEKIGKLYEFGWWDMERIQTESGRQFTSTEFQEGLSVRRVRLELFSLGHQEMNGQV